MLTYTVPDLAKLGKTSIKAVHCWTRKQNIPRNGQKYLFSETDVLAFLKSRASCRRRLLTPFERFWLLIDRKGLSDCWEWQGPINTVGYGVVDIQREGRWLRTSASRAILIMLLGDIPTKLQACHICDNPICCNPTHLFLGTAAKNAADSIYKGRWTIGKRNGRTKLTVEQVREIRERYATGTETYTGLAREYPVCAATIRSLILRETWSHVE